MVRSGQFELEVYSNDILLSSRGLKITILTNFRAILAFLNDAQRVTATFLKAANLSALKIIPYWAFFTPPPHLRVFFK